jgi:hypothetical protein
MIGFYNYFSEHEESFSFDHEIGDYILTDKATEADKEEYRRYQEMQKYAEEHGIVF